MMTFTSLFAIKVNGVVVDENKEPIIGATVIEQGTKNATVTDFDGKFTINIKAVKTATLKVSYLGFKTKKVPLNGRTIVNIEMEEEITTLNEVVAIGYGTMKKSDMTGSLSSVKATDEEAASSISFEKMLQGKAAGVSVSTASAAPGGSVSVRIRGISSLRGNNSPLYVIDGNIVSDLGDTTDPMSAGTGGGNSRADGQNPLAFISPQDIESIEILKDASATAIYGSQGANGVVLITTKQGKTGKPTVTVSANVTASWLAKEMPMLGTEEYVDFYNSYLDENGTKLAMDGLDAVNWQKACTRTSITQNYRASVSGKTQKTEYYLAAGYSDQQGIIKGTGVQKYDIRFNLGQEINDRLSLKSNSAYSTIKTSMTSGTDKLANTRTSIVRQMISFKPYRTSTMTDTDYDEELTSPEAWFSDYDDDSKETDFNTTLTLDYKALNWLTLQLKGGLVYRNKERSMWYGTQTYTGAQTNGKAGIASATTYSYDAEAMAIFKHKFSKLHTINGTLGVVYNSKDVKQTSITGENFFAQDLRADGISQAGVLYPYMYAKTGDQLFSVLARAIYNYADRYVVTATFRADGSSKFNKDNRFSYFPSMAFAWRINQEPWMCDFDKISNLKLRLGWGQVGNQAISPYQTLNSYSNVNSAAPNGSSIPGIVPSRISNPNLKWETSEQYNIGIDLGLFDQRLSVTVDAYVKNTKDLLQEISLPYSSGYRTMWINNGKIENKGIEFSVNATPIAQKNLKWDIGANMSFGSNTIKELGMSPSNFGTIKDISGYWGANVGNNTYTKFPANVFLVNHSIGLFMGYATNGIMQEGEYNSAEYQANPLVMNGKEIKAGDVKYVDQNNDNVIDDNDRVILGNPNPDFSFGLTTSLNYDKWTLNMAFNGTVGNDIINANLIDEEDVKNANKNVRKDCFYQAWTAENQSNSYPRLGYEQQGVLCDRYVENGSYLRLASLSLNYLFNFKKSNSIKSLTLNATLNNVFTITSYSGFDPDINTFANDTDRMGIDLTSYPASRSFTFGVIANF